jgi:hypothetical protein
VWGRRVLVAVAPPRQALHRHCIGGSPAGRAVAVALFRWRLVLTARFGQAAVNLLLSGRTQVRWGGGSSVVVGGR